jgi:hypothetical protein
MIKVRIASAVKYSNFCPSSACDDSHCIKAICQQTLALRAAVAAIMLRDKARMIAISTVQGVVFRFFR